MSTTDATEGNGKTTKGPRQQRIKGTEQESIPGLDAAIEEYVEIRDKRMRLTEKEIEARTALEELMRQNKKKTYKHDGYIAELQSTEKAKVRSTLEEMAD